MKNQSKWLLNRVLWLYILSIKGMQTNHVLYSVGWFFTGVGAGILILLSVYCQAEQKSQHINARICALTVGEGRCKYGIREDWEDSWDIVRIQSLSVCVCICLCVHVYSYIYIHTHIHRHINRHTYKYKALFTERT